MSKSWNPVKYARRRKAGQCSSCGRDTGVNLRTGKPYARCLRHREMATRATQRYAKAARERWLALGCCVECGSPCGRNPETGKPFRRCLTHRIRESELHHAYRKRCEAQDARVLAVLVDGMPAPQIRKSARMDSATCLLTLRRLVAAGVLDRTVRETGRRGRPSFVYQRHAQEVAA